MSAFYRLLVPVCPSNTRSRYIATEILSSSARDVFVFVFPSVFFCASVLNKAELNCDLSDFQIIESV